MRILKYAFILISIVISFVFIVHVCLLFARDEKEIRHWLDNNYGIGSYAMEQDAEETDRWIVTLKEYPKIPFHCNVFHDWLALGSPIVQTDFREVFCKNAIKEFKGVHDIGSDRLSYLCQIQFSYSTEINSIEDLKPAYDNAVAFIEFARKEYPILVDKSLLEVRLDIKGNMIQGANESDRWIVQKLSTINKDGLSIKSYEEMYNELKAK